MASNFSIHHMVKDGTLYMDLKGDFDGGSAMELLNELVIRRANVEKIFVNTDNVKAIHAFGKAVFTGHFSLHHVRSAGIVFTGSNRTEFIGV